MLFAGRSRLMNPKGMEKAEEHRFRWKIQGVELMIDRVDASTMSFWCRVSYLDLPGCCVYSSYTSSSSDSSLPGVPDSIEIPSGTIPSCVRRYNLAQCSEDPLGQQRVCMLFSVN